MKPLFPFLSVLLSIAFLSGPSCDVINPPEVIPAYIRIDTILLTGSPGSQGFLSHNISDAWIIVNNETSYAAYELPVVFPVFEQGQTTITVSAGIRRNGISNAREPYPLFQFYEVQRNLAPLDTVVLMPEVRYQDDAVFQLLENFETGNNFTETLESTGSFALVSDPSKVFEGNLSAQILLSADGQRMDIRSSEEVLPDENLRPVYLEIDYRCNQSFEVWVRSIPVFGGAPISSYIISLSPKEDWNKIYVYLTDQLGLLDDAVYQVSIQASKDPEVEEGEILLDNIKLIYR